MPKRAGALLTLLLAAVLALTGCGGGDSGDGSGGSDSTAGAGGNGDDDSDNEAGDDQDGDDGFDTCSLLEPADLEAVFGSPFDAGELTHQDQTGADQCIWGNTDPPPVKQFSIVVLRDGHLSENFEDAGVTVESLYEDTKEFETDPEEIDLGDDAYLSGSNLSVLDGDTLYTFSTVLGTSPEAIAGLKTLAEQVVG